MLTVVVIITVLVAIAWPIYDVSVAKSRMLQLQILETSIINAQQDFFLANNHFSEDFDNLIISNFNDNHASKYIRSNSDKSIVAGIEAAADGVTLWFDNPANELIARLSPSCTKKYCFAKDSASKAAQKVCQDLMNNNNGQANVSFSGQSGSMYAMSGNRCQGADDWGGPSVEGDIQIEKPTEKPEDKPADKLWVDRILASAKINKLTDCYSKPMDISAVDWENKKIPANTPGNCVAFQYETPDGKFGWGNISNYSNSTIVDLDHNTMEGVREGSQARWYGDGTLEYESYIEHDMYMENMKGSTKHYYEDSSLKNSFTSNGNTFDITEYSTSGNKVKETFGYEYNNDRTEIFYQDSKPPIKSYSTEQKGNTCTRADYDTKGNQIGTKPC